MLMSLIGAILFVAAALCVYRIVKGPTLADRVAAAELLSLVGVGGIGSAAIVQDSAYLLDIVLIWSLVSFLGTVGFSRYLSAEATHAGGADSSATSTKEHI